MEDSISFVTPVYNEEAILEKNVSENIAIIDSLVQNYELILVNDGSIDKSWSLMNKLGLSFKKIVLVNRLKNEGIGAAILTGILMAKKGFVICIPADYVLTQESLSLLQSQIEHADVVLGYRENRVGYSKRMKINSFAFGYLVEVLFKIYVKDFNWIHGYKLSNFNNHNLTIDSKGIFSLAEVVIRAKINRLEIIEIPIKQTQRLTGVATASRWSSVFKTLYEMFVFRVKIYPRLHEK